MRQGCLLLMVVATLCPAVAAAAPIRFTTVDRGEQSNIDTPAETIVRTAAQWNALWRRHASEGQPRPAVDFTRSTIVAVFLGSRSTAGYSVEITKVERDGTALIVTYREERPKADAILAQMLTMPYHIVRLPTFSGPIRFKHEPAK